MVDRLYLWLGAGVVAAGVTVGMLAGAGVAHAETESDADGGAKTSQSAKPADNKQDSSSDDAGQDQQQSQNVTDAEAGADDDAELDRDTVAEKAANEGVRTTPKYEPGKRTAKLINNVVAAVTQKPARTAAVEKADPIETVDPVATPDPVDVFETEPATTDLSEPEPPKAERQPTPASAPPAAALARAPPSESDVTLAAPLLTRSQVTATASPPIQVPPVVSAIGTAVFGLISFAESVFEGPPLALPGSNVTVERSTLDLGNGHVVPADWYFPEGYDPEQ